MTPKAATKKGNLMCIGRRKLYYSFMSLLHFVRSSSVHLSKIFRSNSKLSVLKTTKIKSRFLWLILQFILKYRKIWCISKRNWISIIRIFGDLVQWSSLNWRVQHEIQLRQRCNPESIESTFQDQWIYNEGLQHIDMGFRYELLDMVG